MTAETIAKALGGRKAGGAWMACCPAHDDREPSLSIIDGNGGKVLVRCHAGCDQRDVIGALRSRGVWATEGRHEGRSLRYNGSRLPAAPDRSQKCRCGPESKSRGRSSGRAWRFHCVHVLRSAFDRHSCPGRRHGT